MSLYDTLPLQHSIRHSDAIENTYKPRAVADNAVKFKTCDTTTRTGCTATWLNIKFSAMDTINWSHTWSGTCWCAHGCPSTRHNICCVFASNTKLWCTIGASTVYRTTIFESALGRVMCAYVMSHDVVVVVPRSTGPNTCSCWIGTTGIRDAVWRDSTWKCSSCFAVHAFIARWKYACRWSDRTATCCCATLTRCGCEAWFTKYCILCCWPRSAPVDRSIICRNSAPRNHTCRMHCCGCTNIASHARRGAVTCVDVTRTSMRRRDWSVYT